jgi:uncharacterized membrane protein
MQGIQRRIVHVTLYEAIAIVLVGAGFMLMAQADMRHAGSLSVLSSVVALVWNVVFNHDFLAYTFVFNEVFDRVFGLPRSAQPA